MKFGNLRAQYIIEHNHTATLVIFNYAVKFVKKITPLKKITVIFSSLLEAYIDFSATTSLVDSSTPSIDIVIHELICLREKATTYNKHFIV